MYLAGFGNHHQTEAIAGALPTQQNSPQHCHLGLYAEQLNGSAFTRPRQVNLHTWLYRTHPSTVKKDYQLYSTAIMGPYLQHQPPNPMRWLKDKASSKNIDFIDGLFHLAGSHHVNAFRYQSTTTMTTRYFSNHDGELLFVPYHGGIRLMTELGQLEVLPGHIVVIPRGIVFKVELIDKYAEGYLCENAGLPFTLPQLGPLGANSLANPRHFLYPTAAVEAYSGNVDLICKYQHNLWIANAQHSPLNVVAWHGNYAPYSYDLSLFNTINSVSFDHPDPSIFTVLTSESEMPGIANMDFVIFPPRWMVAEHTFRPPYFHRNIMSELMGLVKGEYDAKSTGFEVGGVSIHNCMTPHGPDAISYQQATTTKLKPSHYDNTLAFMFESRDPWLVTEQAYLHHSRDEAYSTCWQDLKQVFLR